MKMKKGTAYGLSALIVLGYLAVVGFLVLSNVAPVVAVSDSGGTIGGDETDEECWEGSTGLIDCDMCCMSELGTCQVSCDFDLAEAYDDCEYWYDNCVRVCGSDVDCTLDCEISQVGCENLADDRWDSCYDHCDLGYASCAYGCATH